jgi:ferritin-like metal-binding protein YciE
MANEPKKLHDLFHDTLKDIYYAEKVRFFLMV